MKDLTFIRFLVVSIAWMTIVSLQAQTIRVVDKEGRGIPYAMVLNTKGNLIGTTNFAGTLANIGEASEVLVTHMAYKPQQVLISSLKDGNITMEDNNYSLPEAIPNNPSFYAETYYRAYTFYDGNLIHYTAGIMPVECNLKNGKITTGSHKDCRGAFYSSPIYKLFFSMNAMRYFNNHFSQFSFIVPSFLEKKKMLGG